MKRQTTVINDSEIDYVDVATMTKAEWESFRSSLNTVGGSDIGTICGVNKWKDAPALWREKIGLVDNNFEGNDYTTIGTFMEHAILEMFCYGDNLEEIRTNHRKQQKVRESHDPFVTYFPRHMEWGHLNIDGLITKDDERDFLGVGVAEIKKISARASEAYVGGIPVSYLFQLQYYMWGLRAMYGYVAAFVGENNFIVRQFDLDENIIKIILDKVPRFVQAVNVGREVMSRNISMKEKLRELDVVEDTFSDVLQPINFELLSKWLIEDVNIDRRVGSITIEPEVESWIKDSIVESEKEIAAKLEKQKLYTSIKKHMTKLEANVMENDNYIVKFNKRLSIKKYD